MKIERMTCGLIEVKFAESDAAVEMEFSGYGAVFGNVDKGGDMIMPGAFAEYLSTARKSGGWPAMLSQHGAMGFTSEDLMPVGLWTDMAEDGHGLKMTGVLADTQRGVDHYKLLKMKPRPAITGLSIGYIAKEAIPRTRPEEPRRTLKRIDLVEVSLVTFPMNGLAVVNSVKSVDELETMSDLEGHLREVCGMSKSEAKTFISRVKGTDRRDVDDESKELNDLLSTLRGVKTFR